MTNPIQPGPSFPPTKACKLPNSVSLAWERRPEQMFLWPFLSQRDWVWQLTSFGGRKWRSGLNRISHPDWLKLSVKINWAPNQNTRFSSSLQRLYSILYSVISHKLEYLKLCNCVNAIIWRQESVSTIWENKKEHTHTRVYIYIYILL